MAKRRAAVERRSKAETLAFKTRDPDLIDGYTLESRHTGGGHLGRAADVVHSMTTISDDRNELLPTEEERKKKRQRHKSERGARRNGVTNSGGYIPIYAECCSRKRLKTGGRV